MSVAWFTRLYALNDAGKFEEAAAAAKRYLKKRPKDYALHLQCGKSLLSLGEMEAARAHLELSRDHSKGLAAWPWFYLAALHARLGEQRQMFEAIEAAMHRDAKLSGAFIDSPFFAAWVKHRRFRSLIRASGLRPSGKATSRALPVSRPKPRRRRAKP